MIINDITLNFLDNYFPFYEWLESDDIKSYKKCYVYKVETNVINDIIQNEIMVLENLPKNMPIIFTDEYSFVGVDFIDNKSVYKSSIPLNEEEKIIRLVKYLDNYKLKYKIISNNKIKNDLRCEKYIKSIISQEIKSLIESNNLEKIKFLYYEWFNKEENDINKIVKNINKKLENSITQNEKRIFNLIKASYKVV